MDLSNKGFKGRWLLADCGKYSSEMNCKLVMMAPEDQKEDLLEAAVAHAVKKHSHQDSPELRSEIGKLFESVES